ncbi:MAG: hypothetical protein FJ146_19145 [Deltaproteobacteria bacterium]|nr:hypothetical protein [Deltaproteobacteria bacterium]
MKTFILSIAVVALAACATVYKPEVFDNGSGLYSLRLHVGTRGDNLYEDNFDKKARDLCGGDYTLLKKKKWNDGQLDWDIKCSK